MAIVRRQPLQAGRALLLGLMFFALSGQAAPGIWWEGRWAQESAWCAAPSRPKERPIRLTRSHADLGESFCRVDRVGRLSGGVRLAATCNSQSESGATQSRIDIRPVPEGIEVSSPRGPLILSRCPA